MGVSSCPVASADDPITTVQVLEDPGHGFNINTDVNGNVFKTWIVANDDSVLMFSRNLSNTLSWGLQTASNASADMLSIVAGWANTPAGKTCCWLTCDDGTLWRFNTLYKDCTSIGGGCQTCTEYCTDGWVNCPAGTTGVVDLRPR